LKPATAEKRPVAGGEVIAAAAGVRAAAEADVVPPGWPEIDIVLAVWGVGLLVVAAD
jgi:hypothetical protein